MAPKIDDKWLWLGFGVFFFAAAKGLQYAIRDTIALTRIPPSHFESRSKQYSKQPEDTISLENLRILAESPNSNISNAAISLIVSRFRDLDNGANLIAKDVRSKDDATRQRAETAINFLESWGVDLKITSFPTTKLLDAATDSSVAGVRLTASEFARRLSEAEGGFAGGPGWVGGTVIPSPQDPVAGWSNVPRERPVDTDVEEVERRRRRREAMVLHEGSGAVREDDIFRPRG